MFKCVEDLSGAICWNSSTKQLMMREHYWTPNAFKNGKKTPESTLESGS